VLLAVDALGLRTRVVKMWEYQRSVTEDRGLAATREGVWSMSLQTIARYPWFGVAYTGLDEEIPHEYRRLGYYLAHNVFLDVGRGAGIPGVVLFSLFFFYPFGAMLQRRRAPKYLPFLLVHVAFLVFFMGLSFQFYKTVWVGWMLMAMAADGRGVDPPAPGLTAERYAR
jgi:O-antigen ligase